MRRRRWRTAVLWAGWTLCALVAAAFVVSAWWFVALDILHGPLAFVLNGALGFGFDDFSRSGFFIAYDPNGLQSWNVWEWQTHRHTVPLYAVFIAVAIPTLLVWRFVPKFPRGHCRRCGYNLTGLTEARCPECGTGFEEPMSTRT